MYFTFENSLWQMPLWTHMHNNCLRISTSSFPQYIFLQWLCNDSCCNKWYKKAVWKKWNFQILSYSRRKLVNYYVSYIICIKQCKQEKRGMSLHKVRYRFIFLLLLRKWYFYHYRPLIFRCPCGQCCQELIK